MILNRAITRRRSLRNPYAQHQQPRMSRDSVTSAGWQRLMNAVAIAEPHESVQYIFQFLQDKGYSELNCNEFVQYFMKEDTANPWTPYLFGSGLPLPEYRFIMTGSMAEGTSIAHAAKLHGSILEADMMLIFGRCGDKMPLEIVETGDTGYYYLRVRSQTEVSEEFLIKLCKQDGDDFYLSPQKVIRYLRTVASGVFRKCRVKKLVKGRPAMTIGFAEMTADEQSRQNVMIDFVPAILTDIPVGPIDSLPWLSDEKRRYAESQPRLLVAKSKQEKPLQWCVTNCLAEKWLLTNNRCKQILRTMKIIKACYFRYDKEKESCKSVTSYRLKTALLEYFSKLPPDEMSSDWNLNDLARDVISVYREFLELHLKPMHLSNFYMKEVNLLEQVDPDSDNFIQVCRVLSDTNRKEFAIKVKRAVYGLVERSFRDNDDSKFEELSEKLCKFRRNMTVEAKPCKTASVKPLAANAKSQQCARLFEVAMSGDLESLKKLLASYQEDVDCRASAGETPLYVASHCGHTGVVKQLIASGADITSRTKTLSTALLAALRQKHYDIAELLLKTMSKKCAQSREQQRDGDRSCTYIDVTDIFEQTPLIVAVIGDDMKMMNLLLNHGASVNYANTDGNTALHVAVLHGNQEAVDFLLRKGAKPDIQNGEGLTPLMLASGYGHLAIVRHLLVSGADVDTQCKVDGESALHWAARNGSIDVIRLLIEHKANPNLKSLYRRTPLLEAISSGYTEVVRLFLEQCGADARTCDMEGNPYLYYAVQQEFHDIVEQLLGHGSDPNWCHPRTGFTLVHMMCAAGRIDILRLLIRHGADIRPKTRDGRTALQVAFENQWHDTVSFLHQYYADNHPGELPHSYFQFAIFWIVLSIILFVFFGKQFTVQ